ncbi:MAG: nucleoside/nucleotide kinase family protein, partial [Gammaproteobacteria bacterium]|nr:nucleoside/nucleotide kinase family protein [Gammaproteobacteria bacterium]
VPQDGFHYDNAILDRRDRLAAKGAPDTFDTEGFRALLTRLKAEATVAIPLFDRTLDVARNAARLIDSSHRLLLVEGNYLLLQNHPQWRQLKPLFDLTVFLETPVQELRRRLQLRWTDLGFNPEKAREKVEGNDLVNAETVIRYSARSDYVLRFKEIDVASHS